MTGTHPSSRCAAFQSIRTGTCLSCLFIWTKHAHFRRPLCDPRYSAALLPTQASSHCLTMPQLRDLTYAWSWLRLSQILRTGTKHQPTPPCPRHRSLPWPLHSWLQHSLHSGTWPWSVKTQYSRKPRAQHYLPSSALTCAAQAWPWCRETGGSPA